jgi:hypothetical protein
LCKCGCLPASASDSENGDENEGADFGLLLPSDGNPPGARSRLRINWYLATVQSQLEFYTGNVQLADKLTKGANQVPLAGPKDDKTRRSLTMCAKTPCPMPAFTVLLPMGGIIGKRAPLSPLSPHLTPSHPARGAQASRLSVSSSTTDPSSTPPSSSSSAAHHSASSPCSPRPPLNSSG